MKAWDRVLSKGEEDIVNDLTEQLLKSPKFREMTLWFIEKGGMYTITDGNLYTHSHYPVDKEGNLLEVANTGKIGKEGFDEITNRVKNVGIAFRQFHESLVEIELKEKNDLEKLSKELAVKIFDSETLKEDFEKDEKEKIRKAKKDAFGLIKNGLYDQVGTDINWMRFLAWDYESPLYGREMKTWERAYLIDTDTHKEPEDKFYSLVEPKMPEPKDLKLLIDKKKYDKWKKKEGKDEMARYSQILEVGHVMIDKVLRAFELDPMTASFIKGHKPEKGENIGKPVVRYNGEYLNIDAVLSGPAADVKEGYGLMLITTDKGELIEISMAPQRRVWVNHERESVIVNK